MPVVAFAEEAELEPEALDLGLAGTREGQPAVGRVGGIVDIEGLAGTIARRTMVIDRRRYNELYSEGFVCRVDRLRDRLGVVANIGLQEGLERSSAWYTREARTQE